jgi:hypothetical protein
MILPPLFQV